MNNQLQMKATMELRALRLLNFQRQLRQEVSGERLWLYFVTAEP